MNGTENNCAIFLCIAVINQKMAHKNEKLYRLTISLPYLTSYVLVRLKAKKAL